MGVIIGNARISERGTVSGRVGDQTKREVCTQTWETGGLWQYVIRAKDKAVAKKLAAAMLAICNNDNIGYSQTGAPLENRLSLWNEASRNGFKLDKVGKCNCDCSSGVAVCCWAAGVHVSPSMYTGNELAVLRSSGAFDVFVDASHTKSDKLLKAGDILLRKGHTAIVVSVAGKTAAAKPKAKKQTDKSKLPTYTAGSNYKVVADALNVRTNAGTGYPKKSKAQLTPDGRKHADASGALLRGTVVTCKASKVVGGNVWVKIPSGWVAAYYGGEYYVK